MTAIDFQPISHLNFDQEQLPEEALDWIVRNNLWNIWVPQMYGGKELSLSQGLQVQKELARFDGSLGWTQTLCSGANFFIGNLQKEVITETFGTYGNRICLGGSGMPTGEAHKEGEHYRISGNWKYATGAPHLTHFTLNARIMENGKEVTGADGKPQIRSFVLARNQVQVIPDWNTMGLKATASHSFEVRECLVHKKNSFLYNETSLPHVIFKIPFQIFTDLTLWVNYLGMAQHFLREAKSTKMQLDLEELEGVLTAADNDIFRFAAEVEATIERGTSFSEEFSKGVHATGTTSIRNISWGMIALYPKLGMRACRQDHPLNKIFRDYFTATQHINFL